MIPDTQYWIKDTCTDMRVKEFDQYTSQWINNKILIKIKRHPQIESCEKAIIDTKAYKKAVSIGQSTSTLDNKRLKIYYIIR